MTWKRYILWFAHEHVDFRHAEINSLLSLFKINMRWVEEPSQDELYWIVELESEEAARKIASRSISLRWCLEVWGRAKDIESLHRALQTSLSNNNNEWCFVSNVTEPNGLITVSNACPRKLMEPYFSKEQSFKLTVETFCKHYSLPEKIKKIESFAYIPWEGKIRLKEPDIEFMYLEYYGLDPNNIPEKPHDLFIGRLIAEGQRQLITKLSLKTRKFIGNTSMDAQLSVLMANQAQVTHGSLTLDPFVGSGSLLVAAAEFGGYVWGTDIDYMMLHAKTRPSRKYQKERETDESIKANMYQYKTHNQYLDVIVSDFSLPIWKDSLKFDAVITDPPYGIREPTEKIGIDRDNYTLTAEHLPNHIPAKVDYGLIEMFHDLLSFSAKHLAIGKRLVCWFPVYRDDYHVNILPSHKCLKLIANSEQVLSLYTARRLLTYEKISEPIEGDSANAVHFTNYKMNGKEDILGQNEKKNEAIIDFRQRYFDSGEQTRRERKELRAKEKERGRMEKELRLKHKKPQNDTLEKYEPGDKNIP